MSDVPQQAHKIAEVAMSGGASVSAFSAVWSWLGTNHHEISALCAIVGAIVCVAGYWRSRK